MGNPYEPASQGIGIVVFGLGRIGEIHSTNCIQNRRAELRYIVEYELDKARKFVEKNRLHGVKVLHPDFMNEALDDYQVQGAIIGTVTHTHCQLVMACLKKGKSVLCEKPLAESIEDVVKCYEEAEKRNLHLMCAFNRRFDPSLRKFKDDITSGKIGKVRMVKTCSRDYPAPSISYLKGTKGMFHDCSIHDIDLLHWIVGELPSKVYSQASAFNPEVGAIGDVDTIMITMKFPSGVLGQIELCRFASYGYDQRVEVLGEDGMLQSANQPQTSVVYSNSNGISEDVLKYSFLQRYADSYKAELDHYFDVLEEKAKLYVPKEDVLAASRVVTACEESYKSGQAVTLG